MLSQAADGKNWKASERPWSSGGPDTGSRVSDAGAGIKSSGQAPREEGWTGEWEVSLHGRPQRLPHSSSTWGWWRLGGGTSARWAAASICSERCRLWIVFVMCSVSLLLNHNPTNTPYPHHHYESNNKKQSKCEECVDCDAQNILKLKNEKSGTVFKVLALITYIQFLIVCL